jgi:DDE superfamily endonuclease
MAKQSRRPAGKARSVKKQLRRFICVTQTVLGASYPEEIGLESGDPKEQGNSHRERTRKRVNDIFNEQGPYYVRRAYRMHADSFWMLHGLLKEDIGRVEPSEKTHKNGARNGLITTSVRLSAALRYFAGGRPDDIALVHGISHSEVFNSVWKVVDAVNKSRLLEIKYPESHKKQREIAKGFERKSDANFPMCGGCTDGMLLWIEKPSAATCKISGSGAKKFYCGRKKKFGVNLQGVADVEGRFLDVSIGHPGSTSDFLSFSTSPLYYKLEKKGFLAAGICLFGDCAYVNTDYMATPFKSVRSGSRDDYNFYHSQVQ